MKAHRIRITKPMLTLFLMGLTMATVMGGCAPKTGVSPAASPQTIVCMSNPQIYRDLKAMIDRSSLILVGKVEGPYEAVDAYSLYTEEYREINPVPPGRVSPMFLYDVTVLNCWKGDAESGDHITMYTTSGLFEGVNYIDENMAGFEPGFTYLLFLDLPDLPGIHYYSSVSITQGILRVEGDAIFSVRGNPWFAEGQSLADAKAMADSFVQAMVFLDLDDARQAGLEVDMGSVRLTKDQAIDTAHQYVTERIPEERFGSLVFQVPAIVIGEPNRVCWSVEISSQPVPDGAVYYFYIVMDAATGEIIEYLYD